MTDEDRDSSEQDGGGEPATATAESRAGGAPGVETAGPATEAAVEASGPAGGPSRRWLLTAWLALLLAIVAAALTGFSWWQYRQLSASVRAVDARTRDRLQEIENSLGSFADKLNASQQQTQQALQQSGQRIDELQQRVQPIPGRVAQLQQQLDALQGGSADARATWLRAEARYYLRVANTQLQLAHDWHGAVQALNLADGRLRQLADPGLAPVRRLIAQEVDALQAVQLPDIDGLVARLGALESRVGKLPLRAATPESFSARTPPVEKTEPGLTRFWAAIKRALTGLVRVQRREQPVRRALSAEQRVLIRQRLALELQLAEVAAMRRRPAAFRASIDTAHRLLTENFASNDAAVAAAEQTLMQMSDIDIAPAPPDISQSLARLQAAGGGI